MFKRLRSDKANAITILSLTAIMLIATMGSLVMDFSKNVQLKSAYENAAQQAAQAGVRHIHPHGGLKKEAIGEVFRVYHARRNEIVGDSTFGHGINGKAYDIRVRACTHGGSCTPWTSRVTVNRGGSVRVPNLNANFLNAKYTRLQMEVREHSTNQLMGLIGKEFKEQIIPIEVEARTHYN